MLESVFWLLLLQPHIQWELELLHSLLLLRTTVKHDGDLKLWQQIFRGDDDGGGDGDDDDDDDDDDTDANDDDDDDDEIVVLIHLYETFL